MTTTHLILRYAHISMATVALFAGAAAMTFKKGSPLHGKAGTVFFVSMMIMASSGLIISVFITPIAPNVMGGSLTLYLTATAWLTVWQEPRSTGRLDIVAMIWGVAVAMVGINFGLLAGQSPKPAILDGFPAPFFFVMASIVSLAVLGDFRMIGRGGLTGAPRTTRHLWRMSLAFFMATGSFFFGQPKFVPEILKETKLSIVFGLAPLVLMIFWLIRIRVWPKLRKAFAPRLVQQTR
jgi:uncharacterized membrane protein